MTVERENEKTFNLFRVFIAVVILLAIAAVLVVYALAQIKAKKALENELDPAIDLSAWMASIPDEARVSEIAIPGCHDAGAYDTFFLAQTQLSPVSYQLLSGARYLDLRVKYDDNGKLVLFHGPVTCHPFEDVLLDCARFLDEHPTETLLLDFNNISAAPPDVRDLLLKVMRKYLLRNDTAANDPDFIDNLPLSKARGKAIVFWSARVDKTVNAPYLFRRNNDAGSAFNCSLTSYYNESDHTKGPDHLIETTVPEYFRRFETEAENKGIFVLQCQLTDTTAVFGPLLLESALNDDAPKLIELIKNNPDYLARCNVIQRDYLTKTKALEIISLNDLKHFNLT